MSDEQKSKINDMDEYVKEKVEELELFIAEKRFHAPRKYKDEKAFIIQIISDVKRSE